MEGCVELNSAGEVTGVRIKGEAPLKFTVPMSVESFKATGIALFMGNSDSGSAVATFLGELNLIPKSQVRENSRIMSDVGVYRDRITDAEIKAYAKDLDALVAISTNNPLTYRIDYNINTASPVSKNFFRNKRVTLNIKGEAIYDAVDFVISDFYRASDNINTEDFDTQRMSSIVEFINANSHTHEGIYRYKENIISLVTQGASIVIDNNQDVDPDRLEMLRRLTDKFISDYVSTYNNKNLLNKLSVYPLYKNSRLYELDSISETIGNSLSFKVSANYNGSNMNFSEDSIISSIDGINRTDLKLAEVNLYDISANFLGDMESLNSNADIRNYVNSNRSNYLVSAARDIAREVVENSTTVVAVNLNSYTGAAHNFISKALRGINMNVGAKFLNADGTITSRLEDNSTKAFYYPKDPLLKVRKKIANVRNANVAVINNKYRKFNVPITGVEQSEAVVSVSELTPLDTVLLDKAMAKTSFEKLLETTGTKKNDFTLSVLATGAAVNYADKAGLVKLFKKNKSKLITIASALNSEEYVDAYLTYSNDSNIGRVSFISESDNNDTFNNSLENYIERIELSSLDLGVIDKNFSSLKAEYPHSFTPIMEKLSSFKNFSDYRSSYFTMDKVKSALMFIETIGNPDLITNDDFVKSILC